MIRKATHGDVSEMVEMAQAMHAESNYSVLSFDPETCARVIHAIIDSEDGFAVVSHRDELVGAMLAHASPAWFGVPHQKVANDYGLYVKPAHRRGASGIQLVTAFREWIFEKGFLQARAGTAAGPAGQGANAIYEGLGFQRSGYCFVLSPGGQRHDAYQTFDHHLAVH